MGTGLLEDPSGFEDENLYSADGLLGAARVGSYFLPGSGLVDAAGYGYGMPSMAENIYQGNFGDAALQGAGVLGDMMYAAAPITAGMTLPLAASLKGMRAARGMPVEEAIQIGKELPYFGTEAFPAENLLGKKVVFVPADLLDTGRMYSGLAEAPIEPRPLLGGSQYGTMQSSLDQGLGFASLSPAIANRIAGSGADYMLVSTMTPTAHASNITLGNTIIDQLQAYRREGFITPENQIEITKKLQAKYPDMPDPFGDDIYAWMQSVSFEMRKDVAKTLDQPGMRKLGTPPIEKILSETVNPVEAGYPLGQGSVLVRLNQGENVVDVAAAGGRPHESYPIGILGDPDAIIPYGVPVGSIFDEYLASKYATGSTPASAYRALTMALPTAEITAERLARIPTGQPGIITSARQASLYRDVAEQNWRSTAVPVNQGGLSPAEVVREVENNALSASLSKYTPSGLAKGAKDGSLVFYGLGSKGGSEGKIYFGLNRGYDYGKEYGIKNPELSDNEVAIVGVMNNEMGKVGRGLGSSSILKAIEEGATVLDAYAVPTKANPKGFLPKFYSQFGFVEVERIPFDQQYATPQMLAQWRSTGWDESMGFPDVVIMKWKGDENARTNATQRVLSEGLESLTGSPSGVVANARAISGSRSDTGAARPRGEGVGSDPRGDRGGIRGNVGGGVANLQRGLLELENLPPPARAALGLLE